MLLHPDKSTYSPSIPVIQIGFDIYDKPIIHKPNYINELHLIDMKIKRFDSLRISNTSFKIIHINWNYLTELIIPEGTIMLYCDNNQLNEIYLPSSLKYISLDHDVKIVNLNEIVSNESCLIEYAYKHPSYIKGYV